MVEIDGSFGEGGGQILRTSLALSLITNTPFRMINIRRNRSKPGLRRQHLTAVRAAARIGSANVEGAALNSPELSFRPGKTTVGDYEFDVGSAGSTTLVFQTVLPALLGSDKASRLTFIGGTHNHGGPPWHFLAEVFLPAMSRMAAQVGVQLDRYGFAPGGEGRWTASVHPVRLKPFRLHTRGDLRRRSVRALVSNLPTSIAERELSVVRQHMPSERLEIDSQVVQATGPGNVIMISAAYENVTELATGFGRRGFPAEKVALEAVECWRAYERTDAPVGEHLADQLLLPLALAGGGSFTTVKPSLHTITNAEVIRKFLPVRFTLEPTTANTWTVSVD